MTLMGRLARRPALHFVLLGGLTFAVARWSGCGAADTAPPVGATREEILWREALAAGLDKSDPLVRRRLALLGRLVADGEVEDAAHLEAEARRLGLAETDLVLRRHLVQTMELALAHAGPSEWPDEEDVAAYHARHAERYRQPGRVRVRHLFFARDRRGVAAERAATEALAALRVDGHAGGGSEAGDAFLWGADLAMSEPELARRLGPAFAADVTAAPLRRWTGPVRSPYGVHVVRVEERIPPSTPPLASVRSRVVHAMLAETAAARVERRLAERRMPGAG